MPDETVKVETADVIIVEDEEVLEETPEVEVEEPKPEKPKKEKKPKPEKGKGRQEKGKGAEKGVDLNKVPVYPKHKDHHDADDESEESADGAEWWNMKGQHMVRKGHSARNVILKASHAAGVPFDKFVDAMKSTGTVQEKAESLFS